MLIASPEQLNIATGTLVGCDPGVDTSRIGSFSTAQVLSRLAHDCLIDNQWNAVVQAGADSIGMDPREMLARLKIVQSHPLPLPVRLLADTDSLALPYASGDTLGFSPSYAGTHTTKSGRDIHLLYGSITPVSNIPKQITNPNQISSVPKAHEQLTLLRDHATTTNSVVPKADPGEVSIAIEIPTTTIDEKDGTSSIPRFALASLNTTLQSYPQPPITDFELIDTEPAHTEPCGLDTVQDMLTEALILRILSNGRLRIIPPLLTTKASERQRAVRPLPA